MVKKSKSLDVSLLINHEKCYKLLIKLCFNVCIFVYNVQSCSVEPSVVNNVRLTVRD